MALSVERISSPECQPLACSRVFTDPAATFRSLKGRPRWLYPLLISGIYSVLVNLYVIQRIGFSSLLRTMLQNTATLDAQSVLDAALERKAQVLFFQGVSTFASTFFTAFVVAKILWLILEVIGEDLPFKRVLAVVAHVTMLTVMVRESMLALTATVMASPENLDLRNPLATNPAFFLRASSPYVHRLLASFDLIILCKICLLALGLAKVSDHLSLRMAFVAIVVPWSLYVVASLFLPGLF